MMARHAVSPPWPHRRAVPAPLRTHAFSWPRHPLKPHRVCPRAPLAHAPPPSSRLVIRVPPSFGAQVRPRARACLSSSHASLSPSLLSPALSCSLSLRTRATACRYRSSRPCARLLRPSLRLCRACTCARRPSLPATTAPRPAPRAGSCSPPHSVTGRRRRPWLAPLRYSSLPAPPLYDPRSATGRR